MVYLEVLVLYLEALVVVYLEVLVVLYLEVLVVLYLEVLVVVYLEVMVVVYLEVLVVVEEAPPDLVDGEVEGVLLIQQVGVVPVGQRGLHLNHLPGHLRETEPPQLYSCVSYPLQS